MFTYWCAYDDPLYLYFVSNTFFVLFIPNPAYLTAKLSTRSILAGPKLIFQWWTVFTPPFAIGTLLSAFGFSPFPSRCELFTKTPVVARLKGFACQLRQIWKDTLVNEASQSPLLKNEFGKAASFLELLDSYMTLQNEPNKSFLNEVVRC